MVSSPLDLTPSNSVDVPGLSVATAQPRASDNRAGSIYDSTIAACVPIYSTPLTDTDYLVLFSRRWTAASASPVQTGYYISYTIDNTPGWMIVNAPTGTRRPVTNSYDIPMSMSRDSAILTAACSVPPYSTYLLNSVTHGSTTSAVLQHAYYNQSLDTLGMLSEEVIPDAALAGPPVALVYNLPGIDNLILTAEVTARIFTRNITTWNHVAITSLNPGITLPSTAITPVYRTDTNTTTTKFQSYFGTSGTGSGTTSAQEALTTVETTAGAITFVEKPFAAQSSYPTVRFPSLTVRFDRGLFLQDQYLYVFGATPGGKVCMARKRWGRIGIAGVDWEYFTGQGWDIDPTEVGQLTTTTGLLTSVGPISAFSFERNRIRIACVTAVGSNRYAQVYSRTNALDWKPSGSPIPLGSAADGSYQNGTLQFHPQLRVVESLIDTPDASTAIPYSYTTKVFGTGTSGLHVTWGAWQISRLY